MTRPATIDAHAHVLDIETIRLLQAEVPSVAPRLTPIDDDFAVINCGSMHYAPFPRGAWDMEKRLADMARYGFDRQLVAVCPQTLLYDQDPQLTLAASQVQNAQIGRMIRERPDTFAGLATAPMQAPELAARELRRTMTEDGLSGIMIGSNTNGKNLDDPELEPFWEAAEDLGAFVLVHPVHIAGGDRQKSYYLKNIIGNPLDTTIAAACLVFGGVLDRHPKLTFMMSHGGGFTPYQVGRMRHGWTVREEARKHLKNSPEADLDKLIYDTILHDPRPLKFMIDMAGPERVLLGSDYPFDMGQYDCVEVVQSLKLSTEDEATILSGAASRLLRTAFAVPA